MSVNEVIMQRLNDIADDISEIKSEIKDMRETVADLDRRVIVLEHRADRDKWIWGVIGGIIVLTAKEAAVWFLRDVLPAANQAFADAATLIMFGG